MPDPRNDVEARPPQRVTLWIDKVTGEPSMHSHGGNMTYVPIEYEPVRASQAPEPDASEAARAFHEAYERLAPQFSYKTRKESAVPWELVPENNKALMEAVAAEVLAGLSTDEGLREAIELAEQATGRAERFGDALTRISDILGDDSITKRARIFKARTVLAGLDQ